MVRSLSRPRVHGVFTEDSPRPWAELLAALVQGLAVSGAARPLPSPRWKGGG